MGGLGIENLQQLLPLEYESSVAVTEPLVECIIAQSHQPPEEADMRSRSLKTRLYSFMRGYVTHVQIPTVNRRQTFML